MKTFITAALTLLLFSCHKTQDAPLNRQREIATELGFDVNKIQFTNTSKAPQLSLKTIEEAKQYFNDQRKKAVPFKVTTQRLGLYKTSDTLENGTPINVIYSTSMTQWWLWVGYNVNFSWERSTGGGIQTSNWNSGLVGMTLGVSWDQQSVDSYTYNGSVYFTIKGYQNYNLFVEGIGTMFTEPVTIQGVYNTTTGTGS